MAASKPVTTTSRGLGSTAAPGDETDDPALGQYGNLRTSDR